jgi:hypothetical protein
MQTKPNDNLKYYLNGLRTTLNMEDYEQGFMDL